MSSEISKFYTDVLFGGNNQLSTRCRFMVSWTTSASDIRYDPSGDALTYYGSTYGKVRESVVNIMNRFRRYVTEISLPSLSVDGKEIDDGVGSTFVQNNSMLRPSSNKLSIIFLESQVSVVDLMNYWIEFNAKPFLRPLKLNLKMDHVNDYDGESGAMSYEATGCRPSEMEMIDCSHDGRTVKARKVTFGFDVLRPISVDGPLSGGLAALTNYNRLGLPRPISVGGLAALMNYGRLRLHDQLGLR